MTSCSSVKTGSELDNGVDFTGFITFGITLDSRNLKINDLVKGRIINVISLNTKDKGLIESTSPFLLIDLDV